MVSYDVSEGALDYTGRGTITLGGLETDTGKRGFVVSAHVVAIRSDIQKACHYEA